MRTWISLFSPQELRALLAPDLARRVDESQLTFSFQESGPESADADVVNRILRINARTYLLDDLNVKVDRTSMAASLETRSPFLDTELMEYVFGLPGRLKLRRGSTKWLLKRAFRDLLPREIAERRKMGFGVPVGAWFRGELRDRLRERLLDPAAPIAALTRRPVLEQMVRAHQSGTRDWGQQFWALWMLDLWLERQRRAV